MRTPDLPARSSAHCFAWQYAFYTHLLYRKAPLAPPQLFAVTQAIHVMRGHLDPIRVAEETLRTWPFDVID